jgi:hypothetical protein
MNILLGGCSSLLILNTLKYRVLLLAGVLKVHERIAHRAGIDWLYSLKDTTSPREYRPPVEGKTNAGCARTWERINTNQGAYLLGRIYFRIGNA